MEEINETELWIKIENFFVEHFQTEKNPPIETLMFFISLFIIYYLVHTQKILR